MSKLDRRSYSRRATLVGIQTSQMMSLSLSKPFLAYRPPTLQRVL